jgi:hypothetical protein
MIFLFLNSENSILINEFFKEETNTSLRIGKYEFDDVLNLLLIEERLRTKIILISCQNNPVRSMNQIPLVDDENILLKRILAENGTTIQILGDDDTNFSSIKGSLLNFLISIKLYLLKRSLKKRLKE